ncbi:MAG: hypothetical protein GY754_43860 [bacterium]|nr:hypothetical protein [bacterium]
MNYFIERKNFNNNSMVYIMKKGFFLQLVFVLIVSFPVFSCDNLFEPENSTGTGTGSTSIDAPANVSASDGTSTAWVIVNWSTVSNADYYEVWRSESQYGSYSLVNGQGHFTRYNDSAATECVKYYYKIKAVSTSNQKSDFSNIDSGWRQDFSDDCSAAGSSNPAAAITAPANITVSDGEWSEMISISWSAVSGADHYQVWRASSATGTYVWRGESNSVQESYSEWSIPTCVTYYYKVKAVDSKGTVSGFSPYDSGWADIFGPETCK